MKTTNRSLRIVGALLTVLAVFTPSNSLWALGETGGNFFLPYQVQWNGKTLPPDSTISGCHPEDWAESSRFVTVG